MLRGLVRGARVSPAKLGLVCEALTYAVGHHLASGVSPLALALAPQMLLPSYLSLSLTDEYLPYNFRPLTHPLRERGAGRPQRSPRQQWAGQPECLCCTVENKMPALFEFARRRIRAKVRERSSGMGSLAG